MNKNKFYEKVGKLTFSIILTWFIVTGIVYWASTWKTLSSWDTVTWADWSDMVAAIDSKISSVDLSDYYTKSEADTNFASISEAVNAVISTCKICIAHADYNRTPGNWVCKGINDWAANRKLSWDVWWDDTVSVKLICETWTWWGGTLITTHNSCMPEQWASKKTWACTPWDIHTYYDGWSIWTCPSRGWWDPMMIGQKEYKQTCN